MMVVRHTPRVFIIGLLAIILVNLCKVHGGGPHDQPTNPGPPPGSAPRPPPPVAGASGAATSQDERYEAKWENYPEHPYKNDPNFWAAHQNWYPQQNDESRLTYSQQYRPDGEPEQRRIVTHDPPGYENSSIVDYSKIHDHIFGRRDH